jgi:hypothetical protein
MTTDAVRNLSLSRLFLPTIKTAKHGRECCKKYT